MVFKVAQKSIGESVNYPARACASRGYVIGSGVHMFVDEKNI